MDQADTRKRNNEKNNKSDNEVLPVPRSRFAFSHTYLPVEWEPESSRHLSPGGPEPSSGYLSQFRCPT